jgi:hypothetical protein
MTVCNVGRFSRHPSYGGVARPGLEAVVKRGNPVLYSSKRDMIQCSYFPFAQLREMNCSLLDLMTLTVQFSSNGKMAAKGESSSGSCRDISTALSSNRPTDELCEELL